MKDHLASDKREKYRADYERIFSPALWQKFSHPDPIIRRSMYTFVKCMASKHQGNGCTRFAPTYLDTYIEGGLSVF